MISQHLYAHITVHIDEITVLIAYLNLSTYCSFVSMSLLQQFLHYQMVVFLLFPSSDPSLFEYIIDILFLLLDSIESIL